MIAIRPEDIEAARLVLGESFLGITNDECKDLPGANMCLHVLCGSGELASVLQAKNPDSDLSGWWERPYRHHMFVVSDLSKRDPRMYGNQCKCGNSQQNPLHNGTCAGVNAPDVWVTPNWDGNTGQRFPGEAL